jgi:hypothetical protein
MAQKLSGRFQLNEQARAQLVRAECHVVDAIARRRNTRLERELRDQDERRAAMRKALGWA